MTALGEVLDRLQLAHCSHTASRQKPAARSQQNRLTKRPALAALDLCLFRDLKRIIYFDAKVSNGALQLRMAEQ